MRAAIVLFSALLLGGCASEHPDNLVGAWEVKEGSQVVNLVLLEDGTGYFNNPGESMTAPIKSWAVAGETLTYVNAGDTPIKWRVVSVDERTLTVEEPAGSGKITVFTKK